MKIAVQAVLFHVASLYFCILYLQNFCLVWLTLWLTVCWNTTYSGVSSPNLALSCHRLRIVLQIPVVQ